MESTRAKYDEVDQLVKSLFPSALLLDEPMSGLSKYDIDRGEVVISKAFKEMNDQKDAIGIVSWGLMETTMEQVFLKLLVAHDFTSSMKIYRQQIRIRRWQKEWKTWKGKFIQVH